MLIRLFHRGRALVVLGLCALLASSTAAVTRANDADPRVQQHLAADEFGAARQESYEAQQRARGEAAPGAEETAPAKALAGSGADFQSLMTLIQEQTSEP